MMRSAMLHKSTLRSCLNAVSRFNTGLGSASGLATMLMMMIIVPDVILRATISFTIPLETEIGVLLLICKIFLGMPGRRRRGRISIDRTSVVWGQSESERVSLGGGHCMNKQKKNRINT